MDTRFFIEAALSDDFEHYGVKGMKWGVRNDKAKGSARSRYHEIRSLEMASFSVKTKKGETVHVQETKTPKLGAFLLSLRKDGVAEARNNKSFTLSAHGSKVGNASITLRPNNELYLNWLGVNPKERGKGYAGAVFKSAVEFGKQNGFTKITLEVPGNAPDARHIYEKNGFKVTHEATPSEQEDIWGGLTSMQYDIDQSIKHSADQDDADDELDKAFSLTFPNLPKDVQFEVFGNDYDESDHANNELEHYGVLGMKWGVHKDRRRSEKAKSYSDKASAYQKQIDSLTKRGGSSYQIGNLEKKRDQALADAKRKSEGKLTDRERKILAGTAVVGTLVASYATYKFVDSGEARRLATKGAAFLKKSTVSFKKDDSLSAKMSADDILDKVVKEINPDYGDVGSTQNCRRCTLAYAMRRKGYDVTATKSISGSGQSIVGMYDALNDNRKSFVYNAGHKVNLQNQIVKDTAKGLKTELPVQILNGNDGEDLTIPIIKKLASEPEGSFGELGLSFGRSGGHSVAYEVVNGKAVIFDAQSGTKIDYTNLGDLQKLASVAKAATVTRLDNVDLNEDFLLRWVKNATD